MVDKDILIAPIVQEEDKVVTVTMSTGDYHILKTIIKDRKASTYVMGKIKTFSLSLGAVVATWFMLGDKIITVIKGVFN